MCVINPSSGQTHAEQRQTRAIRPRRRSEIPPHVSPDSAPLTDYLRGVSYSDQREREA